MKNEVLVDDFSETLRNFLKKTKIVYKEVLTEVGYSRPQVEVMMYLKCNGKSKMTDIVKEQMVSKSYITAISDKLYEAGFIYREHDKNDRRMIFIDLTLEGKNFMKKYKEVFKSKLEKRIANLSQEEQLEMTKMLISMKKVTESKFFNE